MSFETNPVPLGPLTILLLRRKNFMGARLRPKTKQIAKADKGKQARKKEQGLKKIKLMRVVLYGE